MTFTTTNFFKNTSTWDEKFDSFGPIEVSGKQSIIGFSAIIIILISFFNGMIIPGIIVSILLVMLLTYSDPDIPIERKIIKNIKFLRNGTSLSNSKLSKKSKKKIIKNKKKDTKENKRTVQKIKIPTEIIPVKNTEELCHISTTLIFENMTLRNKKARPYINEKALDPIVTGMSGELEIYFIAGEYGEKSLKIYVDEFDEPIIDTIIDIRKS